MSDPSKTRDDFLNRAEDIILENLSNEHFGVSELAEAMNMSRSNLLRKIQKYARLSASQFIRKIRLNKGREMLQQTSLTVSEISYQVGFGSTSYFVKCFREFYGRSPKEEGKIEETGVNNQAFPLKKFPWKILIPAFFTLVVASSLFFVKWPSAYSEVELEKSIAVLPFKNESNDSSNLYFVNGLMESTLNNLQKIEDLRVISRTSVEKYRNTTKAIPQIAQELNVSYFVEGSGQKIGNRVLLNIQLIEASTDKRIWAWQYSSKVVDIFALQNEVAGKITDAIEVIVTPAELEQIKKKPTENLAAYDYYLKALEPFFARTSEGLKQAIPLFEKAIEYDAQFALAYAKLAIAYYFLDIYQEEKQFTDQINNFADKALLYDSRSAESLIAKAFYYMHTGEYRLALPHLEKALEYNPNSSAVVQTLSDFYARYVPNTAKYLEYALKGIQLDIAAGDSIQKSYIFLHLSNALLQTGFFEEAMSFIEKSIAFNPHNEFAPYVKAFILFAMDGNLERTQNLLLKEWNKDTTRLDILQEVAKIYYLQEDYGRAYFYYKKFVKAREMLGLDIYTHENAKIAMVYERMGMKKEAKKFFKAFSEYCRKDQSMYKNANLAMKYAHEGFVDLAMEHLENFSEQDHYQYWFVLLDNDPMLKPLKSHPGFEIIMQKIEARFWENQAELKKNLVEDGLI